MRNKVLAIIGPTASGKSSLAISIAKEFDGVIINADSMQVYRDLRIITARPSEADEIQAPHRLYGVLDAAEICSAARWCALVVPVIRETLASGKLPVLCGGTGLYLRALMQGAASGRNEPISLKKSPDCFGAHCAQECL